MNEEIGSFFVAFVRYLKKLRVIFSFVFQEYNGGNNNSRDRSLEEKSPRSHHYDTAVKKPRTSEEIQMLSAAAAGDPYSLLLYQNWVASLSGNGNSKVHPGAALAALSNNYAQALKVIA